MSQVTTSSTIPRNVISFLHDVSFDTVPDRVVLWAQRCLLDLVGVAAAGRTTDLSRIITDHAVAHFGAGAKRVPMLFDGRCTPAQSRPPGPERFSRFRPLTTSWH